MRKYYISLTTVFVLSLCSVNIAFANGWYSDFTVKQLQYSRGADGVHIVYSGGTGNPNPDGCDNSDRFIAPYSSNNPMRERAMLSGITTAYAAGKIVKVLLSGCVGGIGGTSYPAIWYFYTM